jgi:hypothetical protein
MSSKGDFINLHRSWGSPVKVENYWHNPLELLKSQAILGHSSREVPSDFLGFRIDTGLSLESKPKYLIKNSQLIEVACFGGSTTFGYYSNYKDSWPSLLNTIFSNANVRNFGLVKGDLWQSLRSLCDLLRHGYRPDICIFFDGVNQYSGMLQWESGWSDYKPVSPQYWNLKSIYDGYHGNSIARYITKHKRLIANLQVNISKLIPSKIKTRIKLHKPNLVQKQNQQIEKFIKEEALLYSQTKEVIVNLLNSFGCMKSIFILQPTVYNLINLPLNPKHDYLMKLYDEICKHDTSVINLATKLEGLDPTHFIDWVHTDSSGNLALAQQIFKILCKEGWANP